MPEPKRKAAKRKKAPSLKEQFAHMRLALIDHWLSLAPERRTNFLRRRVGIASTAL